MKNFFKRLFRRRISQTSEMRKSTNGDYIITITTTYSDGYVKVKEYIGYLTSWRTFPEFESCSLNKGNWLCGIWYKHKYLSTQNQPNK